MKLHVLGIVIGRVLSIIEHVPHTEFYIINEDLWVTGGYLLCDFVL